MQRLFDLEKLLKDAIPEHMLKRGLIVLNANLRPVKLLFEQRRVPEEGWDDDVIDLLLTLFSLMDTDKDPDSARIGEREARVSSPLVSKLAHGFGHGIGRSGNIAAPQPKAAGGSLMSYFTNKLALDMLRRSGAPNLNSVCVVPLATGMAVGLATSVAREMTKGKEVVYPRCDIKSPIKGIQLVGMEVKTVEGQVYGDAVRVPVGDISEAITDETAAIVSTTTFFPPREPDEVKAIARIADERGIPHIINNAYGVQSREIMGMVRGAIDAGRVDAVIQSTDKNFLTPVGGALIASPDPGYAEKVSRMYAGRATAAPLVQLLASLLSMGTSGYERLRDEQEENRRFLEVSLGELAERHGERILDVYNPIAVAMTLNNFEAKRVGHYIYALRVTGPRVLEGGDYGTCCEAYPNPYITMNAAIGASGRDVELAMEKLEKALTQSKK